MTQPVLDVAADPRLDPFRQRDALFIVHRAASALGRYGLVVPWNHVTLHREEPSVRGYQAAPIGITFVVDKAVAARADARDPGVIASSTKMLQGVCADICEAYGVGTTPPVVVVAVVPGVER